MGKRGPTPEGKVANIGILPVKKPKPPLGMTDRAKKLFKKIVAENSASTFDTEAISLLRAFCEADNQHFIATEKLEKEEAVVKFCTKYGEVMRRNPWFGIQKESAAVMTSVSTKLRSKEITTGAKKLDASPKRVMFGG